LLSFIQTSSHFRLSANHAHKKVMLHAFCPQASRPKQTFAWDRCSRYFTLERKCAN